MENEQRRGQGRSEEGMSATPMSEFTIWELSILCKSEKNGHG